MNESSQTRRLLDKNVIVIGGSRGLGRSIVAAVYAEGARVLAVARKVEPLKQLAAAFPGVQVLALDATEKGAPAKVFEALAPDVLIICADAIPHMAPLVEQTWEQFSRNWNSDVKLSLLFSQAALTSPLPAGVTVILISSGAAMGDSPLSGGYAGAKRMQMFLAKYAQKEADRLHPGLWFLALVPGGMMPTTELGRVGVEAYASSLGISPADFIKNMRAAPTTEDVARAVVECASDPQERAGKAFLVSGAEVKLVS
ncbi:short-chain dehydrogenase [Ktedonobacter sp. SOSP1-52]|uniref:SDR family NAD(P)-dependent oxidoreductase n=1 Tax=Ktedonobacter sp. SOSP1-52 TaxID=2778366 RepID=UPI001916B125|nr:SDR family oxidoreductase [Ktedonobacter sp. SOSP1-52]GHO64601.1 short-chain dehydrogenase [Ktedonobacter sp. SOSP1-52]